MLPLRAMTVLCLSRPISTPPVDPALPVDWEHEMQFLGSREGLE